MEWRSLIVGNCPTRAEHGKMDVDDDEHHSTYMTIVRVATRRKIIPK